MSGSDPSVAQRNRAAGLTGSGPQPGGTGPPDDCPGPDFEAVLASPSPDVVATLDVGDLLDIVSVETPFRGVLAVTLDGAHVGALTRDLVRLRACIEAGSEYEAEVRRIAGGSVRILVRSKY